MATIPRGGAASPVAAGEPPASGAAAADEKPSASDRNCSEKEESGRNSSEFQPPPASNGVSAGDKNASVLNTARVETKPELVYANVDESGFTEIESCCMQCQSTGTTRLLLAKIPYFKEMVLVSFECPSCGYRNNEVQSGLKLQDQGSEIKVEVLEKQDLNRQVIKSEHASLKVVEIGFEIPAGTQRGVCSTIEGMLSQAASNLALNQPQRFLADADTARRVQDVIEKLQDMAAGERFPFTILLDDPSGNSHVQSFKMPDPDPQMETRFYNRSKEQLQAMGYGLEDDDAQGDEKEKQHASSDAHKDDDDKQNSEMKKGAAIPDHLRCGKWNFNQCIEENLANQDASEIMRFQVDCPHCGRVGHNNMCEIDIPGFRMCVVMAFVCDFCGARENEVKPGGAYGNKGKKWTLQVERPEDLNRDVLKSHIARMEIPSLDFEMMSGTQGGVFTTLEGMLTRTAQQLKDCHPFETGDSSSGPQKECYQRTISGLERLASDPKSLPFTVILDDIADLSFIGPPNDISSSEPDLRLKTEEYERSEEQNDELGLKDMKTENY